jgi:hypothetical protein
LQCCCCHGSSLSQSLFCSLDYSRLSKIQNSIQLVEANILSKINGLLVAVIVVALMFAGVLIYTHNDKSVELIVSVFGTFIAAWAGGWAAFNAERKTCEQAERNARLSNANKALYTIATMFNVFDNLRRFYIDHEGPKAERIPGVSNGLATTRHDAAAAL